MSLIKLEGRVLRYTFASPTKDFRVGQFRAKGSGQNTIIRGLMSHIEPGVPVELFGVWDVYKQKDGKEVNQFDVKSAIYAEPTTPAEMEGLLVSLVAGAGPKKAKQLVEHFGDQLKQILEERPDRLIECPGIGVSTAKRIGDGWKESCLERHVIKFLNTIDVDAKWAKKILRDLGPNAVEIIRKNPYRLISVQGIAFKKADEIATKMNWKKDAPERVEAVIVFALDQAANSGHCYLPKEELVQAACKEGGLTDSVVRTAIGEIGKREVRKSLITESIPSSAGSIEMVYLPRLHAAEVGLAWRLAEMLKYKPNPPFALTGNDLKVALDWHIKESEKAIGVELTEEQRAAVSAAFLEPVSILTGAPGCGKTLAMKVLVHAAQKLGYNLKLCAPTGRAAQNLAEISNADAQTIHMLLEYDADTGEWKRNGSNRLDADMVILDEASMADIDLAYRVADACQNGKSLVIIGDKDQLPAVSPGRVLDDLITSKLVPVTRLNKIFRQAAKSLIVQNAHRILKGENPEFPKGNAEVVDCFLQEPTSVSVPDPKKPGKMKKIENYEWIKERLLLLCRERIPAKLKLDPIRDIQVVTPMKEGDCGVKELNIILQDALNPKPTGEAGEGVGPAEIQLGSKQFRTGDRVIVMRNNYKLQPPVFNGDIGFVKLIDPENKLIHIDFGGKRDNVQLPFDVCSEDLELAYASTIHKVQGGEFKAVIVIMLKRNWIMLQRNLLYTAITRAKNLLIFMAQDYVIRRSVENNHINQRKSFLTQRLQKAVASSNQSAAA